MKGSNQKGFTLLELLIAVTIFAVGLLTVAGMQVTAMRSNVVADSTSVATAIAQGVLEDILSRAPGDDIFSGDQDRAPFLLDGAAMDRVPGGDNYVASYSIALDVPSPGMVSVDVHIGGARNLSGASREIRLTGFKRL